MQPGAVFPHVSYFFPAPPPRRPADFEVDFEIQKTALTKRPNEEEADILNFRAGSGRAPGVNSATKNIYIYTIQRSMTHGINNSLVKKCKVSTAG